MRDGTTEGYTRALTRLDGSVIWVVKEGLSTNAIFKKLELTVGSS